MMSLFVAKIFNFSTRVLVTPIQMPMNVGELFADGLRIRVISANEKKWITMILWVWKKSQSDEKSAINQSETDLSFHT